MQRRARGIRSALILTGGLIAIPSAGQPPATTGESPGTGSATASVATQEAAPTALVDLVALDGGGRPVLDLKPEELVVTIDGRAREVRSLRYVLRGTGAEEAARGVTTAVPVAAMPARTVLIAVDESTVRRGREGAVASAVLRVVDTLTPGDLVGLILLPQPRQATQLQVDRSVVRTTLRSLTGRLDDGVGAIQAPTIADTPDDSEITVAQDPSRSRRATGDAEDTRRGSADTVSLGAVLSELARRPDRKFVVYVTGNERGPQRRNTRSGAADALDVVDLAAVARANLFVVRVPDSDRRAVGSELERLAKEAGGVVSTVTSKRADLDQLSTVLASGYVAAIDRLPTDRGDRPQALSIQTTRPGVRVIASTRWAARDDPLPLPLVGAQPVTVARATEPRPAGRRASRNALPDAELQAVLVRVGQYVDAYLSELGSVVAEETYVQRLMRAPSPIPLQSRQTRADLLLLHSPEGWVPFRDVFEVDGRPVRDRQDRLKRLFLENPGQAMAEGRRIMEEASRYNLGSVTRTINTPILALSFFQSTLVSTFQFERHGTDTVDGTPVLRIDYEETGRPTQIRQTTSGGDLPSSGSIYVEPGSGRIVRTVLNNRDGGTLVEFTVKYRPNDTLGLWTPSEMQEHYWQASGRGEAMRGEATYSGFRRFQVDTAESVGPPQE